MKSRFYCTFFLLILYKSGFGQLPLDTLDISLKRTTHLTHYYKYLEDCKDYNSSTVLSLLNEGKFRKPEPNRPFNMGISDCRYWLAIAMKNSSAEQKSIQWTFYNNGLLFHLYELNKNGTMTLVDSNSMHLQLKDRSYPVRGVSFKIKFNPKQSKCLLVKVDATTANSIYFPIDISPTEDLLFSEINFSYLIGKYIGYFHLALIINILLGLALKNKLYFFHALYILMIMGFTLADYHFDSLELSGNIFQHWSNINEVFFISMAFYFCIQVFQIFTNQKNTNPKINRYLTWYSYVLISTSTLLLIVSLLANYKSVIYEFWVNLTFYLTLGGFIILICILLYDVFKRRYYSILYLISSAFLLGGFVSYLSGTFKLGRLFLIRPGNIINGLAIEITILTFFFVYKYKREKEELEMKTLESDKHSKSLITVQENERKRIANDLHDDIGNTINGLRLLAQYHFTLTPPTNKNEIDYRNNLLTGMKKVNNALRDISRNLMPKDLEISGLLPTIKNQIELHGKINTNITFNFIHEGDFKLLKPEIEVNIYRIINELLQNIIKHSSATKASVQCYIFDNKLKIIVNDNGSGFNINAPTSGLGIESIKLRLSYLNANYKINSSSEGTTFLTEIPLV